ncbi:MAG: hypothetical protein ACO1RX_20900 [Candidatus Sericytochromatia bacterium]
MSRILILCLALFVISLPPVSFPLQALEARLSAEISAWLPAQNVSQLVQASLFSNF